MAEACPVGSICASHEKKSTDSLFCSQLFRNFAVSLRTSTHHQERKRTMKKLLIIVSVLLLAVIMMITTPAKQVHKEAMMSAIRDFVDDEADSLGLGDNVLTDIGKGIVNKTVEKALNSKLEMLMEP